MTIMSVVVSAQQRKILLKEKDRFYWFFYHKDLRAKRKELVGCFYFCICLLISSEHPTRLVQGCLMLPHSFGWRFVWALETSFSNWLKKLFFNKSLGYSVKMEMIIMLVQREYFKHKHKNSRWEWIESLNGEMWAFLRIKTELQHFFLHKWWEPEWGKHNKKMSLISFPESGKFCSPDFLLTRFKSTIKCHKKE